MKLDKKMAALICDLEYAIGSKCYNPSSYNGWTGDEGCSFRYPVRYYTDSDPNTLVKERDNVLKYETNITPELILTMQYLVGANHLYIGTGLVNVLDILEKRYGISFNELEKQRDNKTK